MRSLRLGRGDFIFQAGRVPNAVFTNLSQKVCKSSNIFWGGSGMIILSGAKPDNLLPLSFLPKRNVLRLRPEDISFVTGKGYAGFISRWAAFRALWRATPKMGAKITATMPLNREEGSLPRVATQAPAGSSPFTSRPL